MEKAEKLLMGIENVLGMASELFDEIARLKQVEEECKTLKEKLFIESIYWLKKKFLNSHLMDFHLQKWQNGCSKNGAQFHNNAKTSAKN
ncbi:LuxR family transcriptional regulator (plasmid) [Priestia megaterium]|uniref:LuxR family transcriptional regulator n=1 Tax=Priestia megaterium TaxID=1404 RepID=UPI00389DA253